MKYVLWTVTFLPLAITTNSIFAAIQTPQPEQNTAPLTVEALKEAKLQEQLEDFEALNPHVFIQRVVQEILNILSHQKIIGYTKRFPTTVTTILTSLYNHNVFTFSQIEMIYLLVYFEKLIQKLRFLQINEIQLLQYITGCCLLASKINNDVAVWSIDLVKILTQNQLVDEIYHCTNDIPNQLTQLTHTETSIMTTLQWSINASIEEFTNMANRIKSSYKIY